MFRSASQSCCRERGALQGDIAVCGELSQCSGHTGFVPTHSVCSVRLRCSGSRLLYREWALHGVGSSFWVFHKSVDLVAPAFCAFPGLSGSAGQELEGRTLPGAARLIPSAAPASVSAARQWGACTLYLFSGAGL